MELNITREATSYAATRRASQHFMEHMAVRLSTLTLLVLIPIRV
jgi:hypothetical protein